MDRIADHFVNYLFDEKQGSRHVHRVAAWIGFVLTGIVRTGATVRINRKRQVVFEHHGHRYKVRYQHTIRPRGGLEVIQVLPGRGAPDGDVLLRIASLQDAEDAYRGKLRRVLGGAKH
jgi:hypothetical protein